MKQLCLNERIINFQGTIERDSAVSDFSPH